MGDGKISRFIQGFIFIAALSFVFALSYADFFGMRAGEPYGAGFQVFVLGLIAVYVFAPFFEEIKIGKILELKKRVVREKERNEKLERKNEQLISQLITVTANVQQSQSNNNFYGVSAEQLRDALKVDKASEEEVKESREENEEFKSDRQIERAIERQSLVKMERCIVKRILTENPGALKNARFNDVLDVLDPLMRGRPMIFDAYYESIEGEVFVEVKGNSLSPISFDRIYIMLNRIYLYRKAKNKGAYLKLILFNLPNANISNNRLANGVEKMRELFEPAIKAKLLVIHEITAEQVEEYLNGNEDE